MNKEKIALLYNLNRHQFEYETEFDSEYTIDSLENALKKDYDIYKVEADKNFNWIKTLSTINPKLVFNICEGFNGPARESVYAAILEQFNYNYSGPDSTNLLMCHNKSLAKRLVRDFVDTPFGYCVSKIEDLNKINISKYPVIVKLNSEGSSMGMTSKSIVHNYDELKEQVKLMFDKYKRNVLIEEYIDGKDISMIFVEGLGALGPCEVSCDAIFYDYEMKTIKDDIVDIKTISGDFNNLKEIVSRIAYILDIKGYAKMDFRVNNDKYYLIEVNSQVSFHPEGEFITCAKTDNYSFDDIVNYIVKNALAKDKKVNSKGVNEIYE